MVCRFALAVVLGAATANAQDLGGSASMALGWVSAPARSDGAPPDEGAVVATTRLDVRWTPHPLIAASAAANRLDPWTDGNLHESAVEAGLRLGVNRHTAGLAMEANAEHRWVDAESFRWLGRVTLSGALQLEDAWLGRMVLQGGRRRHTQAEDQGLDAEDLLVGLEAFGTICGAHQEIALNLRRSSAVDPLWSHQAALLRGWWDQDVGTWSFGGGPWAEAVTYDHLRRTPQRQEATVAGGGEVSKPSDPWPSPFVRLDAGRTWSTISAYDLPWWSAQAGLDWAW